MVADRLADTITVGLLTAATFLLAGPQLMQYLSQNPEAYNSLIELVSSPLLWVGLIFLILFVWFLFVKFPEHKLVVKAKEIWKGLWEGFAVIVRMPGKGRWLLLTVAVWGCYFLQLYVAFFSLTAEVVSHHGILAVLVCFVLSSISMGVPSNGGIGPWQWAIIFGLSLYSSDIPGLTREYATSFANLVMGMQTLLLIVLGIFTFTVISIRKKRQPSK